jgi:hypothetical protein
MFTLTYEGLNFEDDKLPEFVESVSHHLYGKRIVLNDRIAQGDYKLVSFANGFYAYVSNYILQQNFAIELSVAIEEYLALHINQITAGTECTMTLNGKTVSYDDKVITSVFLTGSHDSFILSGTKGACVNRLKIMIPKTWLAGNLTAYDESLLNNYFALQEERLFTDAMDTTYRAMVDRVMHTEDNDFYLSVTQEIVTVITERFFNRLHIKMQKNQWGNEMGNIA